MPWKSAMIPCALGFPSSQGLGLTLLRSGSILQRSDQGTSSERTQPCFRCWSLGGKSLLSRVLPFAARRGRIKVNMCRIACSPLSLVALLMPHEGVLGQAEGWRMVDRFSGFRFEVSGQVRDVGYMEAAQAKAGNLACFGWVQATGRGTVVGEARCSKSKGPLFKEWLQHGPPGAQVDKAEFRDYNDTKIRLHFSHFKILDEARVTCFKDTPHQCPEFARAATTDIASRDRQHEPGGQGEVPVAEVGESATDRTASLGIRNEL